MTALQTSDLDPAHRTLRVRAETTKNRRQRVVPYSAATGELLPGYLACRSGLSRARWRGSGLIALASPLLPPAPEPGYG